eukprot:11186729-Alexandrium_andersonii.AAC.1
MQQSAASSSFLSGGRPHPGHPHLKVPPAHAPDAFFLLGLGPGGGRPRRGEKLLKAAESC